MSISLVHQDGAHNRCGFLLRNDYACCLDQKEATGKLVRQGLATTLDRSWLQ